MTRTIVSPTLCSRSRRRGSAYVLVLLIAMLVTVIGIAAITAARVQLRATTLSNDSEEARLYAQSGIEVARLWINQDPAWRTNYPNGPWNSKVIGAGSFAISGVDPLDGDLTNGPLDPLVLTSTGAKGQARQQIQVTLEASAVPLGCLDTAVISGGNGTFNGSVTCSQTIASNANFLTSGTVDSDVEAVGSISGSNIYGSRTSGVAARKMPDSTAFDYYLTNGTPINYSSLGGGGALRDCLLSPAENPFGGRTNPQGIYVIDCRGNTLTIRNCRIVGTLVVLNAGAGSLMRDSVNLAPAVTGYPCFMVKGDFDIELASSPLSEGGSYNFNPSDTPYNGSSNATMTDTYPSTLQGLVYVSGNLSSRNYLTVRGALVVGGTCQADDTVTVTWQRASQKSPPPGFFDPPQMKVAAHTWKQIVN